MIGFIYDVNCIIYTGGGEVNTNIGSTNLPFIKSCTVFFNNLCIEQIMYFCIAVCYSCYRSK